MVRLFYRLVTVVSCYFLKCERSRFIFLLEADLRMFSPDTFLCLQQLDTMRSHKTVEPSQQPEMLSLVYVS